MRRSRSATRLGIAAAILIAAVTAAVFLIASGFGSGVERELRSVRAGWRTHAASGNLAIVEVDAHSLATLDRWPWPRRYSAAALDRLGAAHARSVAFDIDFSVRSTPADDAAFAAALRRQGGGVILPTFNQYARSGSDRTIDSAPVGSFRDAAFLAGVNVDPDDDGVVRRYPLRATTRGVTRPSIGAMLAETIAPGSADTFPIDYAIDPDTIPRISFVDLVHGRVPAAAIAGKRILIGATAIEIGDRYPVPGRGVIPGVVIQALAAETLMMDGVRQPLGPLPLAILALAAIAGIAWFANGNRRLVALGIAAVLAFVAPIPMDAAGWEIDLVPAMGAIVSAFAVAAAAMVLGELSSRRFVDQESGLANARALDVAVDADAPIDIVVVKLDRLTDLAAAMGHRAAVTALVQLAERLGAVTGQMPYRVEEDTLAWFLPADDGADDALFRALASALKTPVHLGRDTVEVRATFGVAGGVGRDTKDLVAGAQIAARRVGVRGGWDRFVRGDGDTARWELALPGAFTDAVADGEVWVAYQPKVAAADRRVVGLEALVRWRHATRGMISPDLFVPLLEREGRAGELTRFVLDTAVADLARWRRAGVAINMAVNISAALLHDPQIVAMVATAIDHAAIDPAWLTLELTETAIIADADTAAVTLAELRALGVKLSIDDYGTGQSTLSYLKRFPASELKIDKSFVQNVVASPSDRLLIQSTVELAHAMGMTVVAEGVEDEQCFAELRRIGCDTIQGWHTGRPGAARDIDALLGVVDEGGKPSTDARALLVA